MSASKDILIFGVSGFVGGYLVRELKSHGYIVYGSDRAENEPNLDIDAYNACDITDSGSVKATIGTFQPSMVINLAAISSVGQSWKIPQRTIDVNINGTLNIFEAARVMPSMPKILLIGSSEEYVSLNRPLKETDPIDATSPYGISKVVQERFAEIYEKRYGLEIYRTRSFNHAGVGQSDSFVLSSWCKQVAEIQRSKSAGIMRVGNLGVSRDFSDVRDIVRGYRLLLESDYSGEVFNFGSGQASLLSDLLYFVISLSDYEISVEVADEYLRPNDTPFIQGDCEKANAKLGWKTEYTIEQTLRDMFNNYLSRGMT